MGYRRNLSAAQIVEQVIQAKRLLAEDAGAETAKERRIAGLQVTNVVCESGPPSSQISLHCLRDGCTLTLKEHRINTLLVTHVVCEIEGHLPLFSLPA